jgi:hypothetical protein
MTDDSLIDELRQQMTAARVASTRAHPLLAGGGAAPQEPRAPEPARPDEDPSPTVDAPPRRRRWLFGR